MLRDTKELQTTEVYDSVDDQQSFIPAIRLSVPNTNIFIVCADDIVIVGFTKIPRRIDTCFKQSLARSEDLMISTTSQCVNNIHFNWLLQNSHYQTT